jgi:predicted dehydrogenase
VATARHIPSYRRHPDAEIVAVFDRRIERARSVADQMRIPAFYDDPARFFDHGVDVVSICTPPWNHAELAIAAFERGVHVFTEKPMAMNSIEAQQMLDAAASAERLLCVSHNFLFSRSVRKADRLLEDATPNYAFGLQLSSFRRRLPTWYEDLPGGLLMDESPHMLYTLQHFLGAPLELHSARATFNSETKLPASVELQVQGAGGIGQVTMLFETPVSEWHVGLVTRERTIDLDLFRDIVMSLGSDEAHKASDILKSSAAAMIDHASGFVASGALYSTKRLFWGHDVIIGKFVDATLGRGPVPVQPRDSVGIVRLTDAVLAELGLS